MPIEREKAFMLAWIREGKMTRDLLDAAEFSEQVAVKLAAWDNEYHKDAKLCPHYDTDLDDYIPLCQCVDFCKSHPKLGCTAVKLAWVRIAVEEEMDAKA